MVVEEFVQQGCSSVESKEAVLYSQTGDYVAVHFSHDDYYAARVDDFLTIYKSEGDDSLIGFKIKGVNGEYMIEHREFEVVQDRFMERLLSLPKEMAEDLMELFKQHAAAESEDERVDVALTIQELLMPDCLDVEIRPEWL